MAERLTVLAVEPFFGGSHRAFLEGLIRHSRHRWQLVTGKPVHWKWRSRSAPLPLATETMRWRSSKAMPDVVLVSDMLDLPTWRGWLCRDPIVQSPTVVYFHENQWTYPLGPGARKDLHYGYTNLLSALAADACWFNSEFHRRDFLAASRAFVGRMPDSRELHDFDRLAERSDVLPPGFDPPDSLPPRQSRRGSEPVRIGWVSRWEHDKRPDRLLPLLNELDRRGVHFQLVLGGPRPRETPEALIEIRRKYHEKILVDRFAESVDDYWRMLRSMDVVVSTAQHEFFGIAVCEAIWAGAIPVLPRRLSYPELVSDDGPLYDSLDDAASMIAKAADDSRAEWQSRHRDRIASLHARCTSKRIDQGLEKLVQQRPKS